MQDKTDAKVLDMSDAVDGVPQEVSMYIQEKKIYISKVYNLTLVIGIAVNERESELRRGPAQRSPFLLSLSPPQPKPRDVGNTEIVAKERKIELMLGKRKRGEGEGIQTSHSLIPLFFCLWSGVYARD